VLNAPAHASIEINFQIVEKVAACLVSIVESFGSSVDLLDQICHQGVIEKVLPLINNGGLMALSPLTSSVCSLHHLLHMSDYVLRMLIVSCDCRT
jgi:hypothetical protein